MGTRLLSTFCTLSIILGLNSWLIKISLVIITLLEVTTLLKVPNFLGVMTLKIFFLSSPVISISLSVNVSNILISSRSLSGFS